MIEIERKFLVTSEVFKDEAFKTNRNHSRIFKYTS